MQAGESKVRPGNRRQHVRYPIDVVDNVRAYFDSDGFDEGWRPVLIADESYSGCRLIVIGSPKMKPGDSVRIDFGNAQAQEAEIVRVEEIQLNVLSIGCRFVA